MISPMGQLLQCGLCKRQALQISIANQTKVARVSGPASVYSNLYRHEQ